MIWLSVLASSLLLGASLILWLSRRKQFKKRIWRQVQVENLVTVKQHKAGPMEILGEASLLVEFTFNEQSYCCQTAFRKDIFESFKAEQATFIMIDPNNPKQCYYNACQQTRYAKMWVYLCSVLVICLICAAYFK